MTPTTVSPSAPFTAAPGLPTGSCSPEVSQWIVAASAAGTLAMKRAPFGARPMMAPCCAARLRGRRARCRFPPSRAQDNPLERAAPARAANPPRPESRNSAESYPVRMARGPRQSNDCAWPVRRSRTANRSGRFAATPVPCSPPHDSCSCRPGRRRKSGRRKRWPLAPRGQPITRRAILGTHGKATVEFGVIQIGSSPSRSVPALCGSTRPCSAIPRNWRAPSGRRAHAPLRPCRRRPTDRR